MSNIAKAAESSFVDKVEIKSNKGDKSVNLIGFGAFVNMMYYESLMQDTVKVVYTFEDTAKGEVGKTIIEDLLIVGTEEVNVKFKDNNDNKIKLKLHVNNVNPLYEDALETTTAITLVSEEFLHNEGADARVNIRYDGKISDHVRKILKQNLKSKKKLDIEDT